MTLYEFAASIRRFVVFGALGAISLFVLWGLFQLGLGIYRTINPPPGPPPTVGFGKLPKLPLPSLSIEGKPIYLLETTTGELPKLREQAIVAAMKAPQPTLLGEEKARAISRELNFSGQGNLSSDKKSLVFRDDTNRRTLTVDVTTQNFTLETDLGRLGELAKGLAPSGPDAVKRTQDFLRRLGLLKFDFEGGTQTTDFRMVAAGRVMKASSLSEAQFTEVNFFRTLTGVSPESSPVLPPNPKAGLIQLYLTTNLNPDILNTLRLSYSVWEINKSKVETYPLRSITKAWDEVRSGKGTAYLGVSGELRAVTITSVSLAYFDGGAGKTSTAEGGASFDDSSFQKYLQPIYVFSGVTKNSAGEEGEFIAYSRAISDDWVSQ